jgi:hypothetical protein
MAVVMYRWLSMASAGRWITCATSPAPMMPTRSLLSVMSGVVLGKLYLWVQLKSSHEILKTIACDG